MAKRKVGIWVQISQYIASQLLACLSSLRRSKPEQACRWWKEKTEVGYGVALWLEKSSRAKVKISRKRRAIHCGVKYISFAVFHYHQRFLGRSRSQEVSRAVSKLSHLKSYSLWKPHQDMYFFLLSSLFQVRAVKSGQITKKKKNTSLKTTMFTGKWLAKLVFIGSDDAAGKRSPEWMWCA